MVINKAAHSCRSATNKPFKTLPLIFFTPVFSCYAVVSHFNMLLCTCNNIHPSGVSIYKLFLTNYYPYLCSSIMVRYCVTVSRNKVK